MDEATPDMILKYENAIRNGDIAYMNYIVTNYRHYDVPILQSDPYTLLNTVSHEALSWLYEQDYIPLSDMIKALIYDDPLILYQGIDKDIVKEILLIGTWEIFKYYEDDIVSIILDDSSGYLMSLIRSMDTNDEEKGYILERLMNYPEIRNMYNMV